MRKRRRLDFRIRLVGALLPNGRRVFDPHGGTDFQGRFVLAARVVAGDGIRLTARDNAWARTGENSRSASARALDPDIRLMARDSAKAWTGENSRSALVGADVLFGWIKLSGATSGSVGNC